MNALFPDFNALPNAFDISGTQNKFYFAFPPAIGGEAAVGRLTQAGLRIARHD